MVEVHYISWQLNNNCILAGMWRDYGGNELKELKQKENNKQI
jgi:hypothetical protein